MASLTNTASAAGHTTVAPRQEGQAARSPGRVRLSEYGEILEDIRRQPRPSLWQRFTIALAGQR